MRYGKCFWCDSWGPVETHHIFRCVGGASRAKSDRLGLTVDLCPGCHRESITSAHQDAATDRSLKRYGQMKAMVEQGWNEVDFIRQFGRNYLDEEELARVRELQEMEPAGKHEEPIAWTKDVPKTAWSTEDEEKRIAVRSEGFRVTLEVMPY